MRFLKPTLAFIGFATIIFGCNSQIKRVDLKTETDSLSYAIGINMGNNLKNSKIDNVNINAIANAIQDVKEEKKDLMTAEKSMEIIQKYLSKQKDVEGNKNKEEGQKFLAENAKKEGVVSDPEGFQYKIDQEGTGAYPVATDIVKVHYKGSFIDGKEFNSSYKDNNNQPVEFPLNGVIRGWTLGLQKVKLGGKITLWLPSELAYGERGSGPIGPNQLLIFEVELLEIKKPEAKK